MIGPWYAERPGERHTRGVPIPGEPGFVRHPLPRTAMWHAALVAPHSREGHGSDMCPVPYWCRPRCGA